MFCDVCMFRRVGRDFGSRISDKLIFDRTYYSLRKGIVCLADIFGYSYFDEGTIKISLDYTKFGIVPNIFHASALSAFKIVIII